MPRPAHIVFVLLPSSMGMNSLATLNLVTGWHEPWHTSSASVCRGPVTLQSGSIYANRAELKSMLGNLVSFWEITADFFRINLDQ